ncbi:MAG: hypothetical protein ABI193_22200 [Minicystis sp.]
MRDDLPSLSPLERATVPSPGPEALFRVERDPPPPASPLVGLRAGAILARDRLLRRPTALTVLLGAALVLVGAMIEVRVGSAGAVDRALAGTFRLVIPLVCFALAAEAGGRGNLREGLWPLARYGLNRRDLALGVLLVTLAASALVAALFAATSVLLAHAPSSPPLFIDTFQSAWIGALTGLAAAAWLGLAGTFGKRGWARFLPVLADFLLGGSTSFVAALFPHAHAVNLLGGTAPLHLSQPQSSAILLLMTLVLSALTVLRCRD